MRLSYNGVHLEARIYAETKLEGFFFKVRVIDGYVIFIGANVREMCKRLNGIHKKL